MGAVPRPNRRIPCPSIERPDMRRTTALLLLAVLAACGHDDRPLPPPPRPISSTKGPPRRVSVFGTARPMIAP